MVGVCGGSQQLVLLDERRRLEIAVSGDMTFISVSKTAE